jgi:hypothetical protein
MASMSTNLDVDFLGRVTADPARAGCFRQGDLQQPDGFAALGDRGPHQELVTDLLDQHVLGSTIATSSSCRRSPGRSAIGMWARRTRARPLMSATRNDTHEASRLTPMLRVTASGSGAARSVLPTT